MRTLILTLALGLGTTGCLFPGDTDEDGLNSKEEKELGTDPENPDSDGDGVMDGDEIDLGLDPTNADSDGDGLTDGDEVDLGLDPTKVDSDGDGYADNHELDEGTDPTDPESRIYQGGWAYNPNKEDWGYPESTSARIGSNIPRFQLEDQFGDTFDLYEWAGADVPIVLDLSGEWCGWCHEVSKRIERQPSALDPYSELDCLADGIENGDILWMTALYSDTSRAAYTGTPEVVARWYDLYPNAHVPVVADQDMEVYSWFQAQGFPAMVRVKASSMVVHTAPGNYVSMIGGICSEM